MWVGGVYGWDRGLGVGEVGLGYLMLVYVNLARLVFSLLTA